MTAPRTKGFCKKVDVDFGNFNVKEKLPRSSKERKECLYLCKSHFCVIWNTEDGCFLKVSESEKLEKNCEVQATCVGCDEVRQFEKKLFCPK